MAADLDATPGGLVAMEIEGGEGAIVQQHDGNCFGVILIKALPGQVQLRLLDSRLHQRPQSSVQSLLLDHRQGRQLQAGISSSRACPVFALTKLDMGAGTLFTASKPFPSKASILPQTAHTMLLQMCFMNWAGAPGNPQLLHDDQRINNLMQEKKAVQRLQEFSTQHAVPRQLPQMQSDCYWIISYLTTCGA